eukprot:Filipodium_phascolosomae@DN1470_c0_g1_i1.p1
MTLGLSEYYITIIVCVLAVIAWLIAGRKKQRVQQTFSNVYDKDVLLRYYLSMKKYCPATLATPPKSVTNLKVIDADTLHFSPTYGVSTRGNQWGSRRGGSYQRGGWRGRGGYDSHRYFGPQGARNFSRAGGEDDGLRNQHLSALLNFVAFKGAHSTLFPNGTDPLVNPLATQEEKDKCNADANREAVSVLKGAKHEKQTSVALAVFKCLKEASAVINHDTYGWMVETCLAESNLREASNFLMEMEQKGHTPDQELLDKVMELYSQRRILPASSADEPKSPTKTLGLPTTPTAAFSQSLDSGGAPPNGGGIISNSTLRPNARLTGDSPERMPFGSIIGSRGGEGLVARSQDSARSSQLNPSAAEFKPSLPIIPAPPSITGHSEIGGNSRGVPDSVNSGAQQWITLG